MDINNHFGVYGVCYENEQLLCIKKNAGPYTGRFDLPGGSQEVGEGLTETLVREILEETGYSVLSYSNPRIYDAMVKERNKKFMVHHIMAFYDFKINSSVPQKVLPKILLDGANDSDSSVWVSIENINICNSSPLVLKVKSEFLGENVLNKDTYIDWIKKE